MLWSHYVGSNPGRVSFNSIFLVTAFVSIEIGVFVVWISVTNLGFMNVAYIVDPVSRRMKSRRCSNGLFVDFRLESFCWNWNPLQVTISRLWVLARLGVALLRLLLEAVDRPVITDSSSSCESSSAVVSVSSLPPRSCKFCIARLTCHFSLWMVFFFLQSGLRCPFLPHH